MSNPKTTKYKVIATYPGSLMKIGDIIEKRKYASGNWYVPGMLSDPDDYPHLFEPINQKPQANEQSEK